MKHGAHGISLVMQVWILSCVPHFRESLGPKIMTEGVFVTVARCAIPESIPTNKQALLIRKNNCKRFVLPAMLVVLISFDRSILWS